MMQILAVGLGGALGAMARYGVVMAAARLTGGGFPVGVLSVNVVGSFLMGVVFVLVEQRGMTHLAPFVMGGLLGGFTTFSAFSLEAVSLWERGAAGQAGLYVAMSVVLSIAGLVAGLAVARGLFA